MRKIRIGSSDILFEDENYLALNKKPGEVVHQTLDRNRPNLFNALQSFLKQRDRLEDMPYLTLLHRLDVDTSGILLFGKTKKSNGVLEKIFANREAIKKYHAICYNHFTEIPSKGTLENFLKKEKVKNIEKMVNVKAGGQKTITKYQLIEKREELALVEFELVTGRIHQIRAQSSLEGFSILGDTLYGDKVMNDKFQLIGQLLHAKSFSFFDRLSNKEIIIEAPVPFSLDKLTQKVKTDNIYVIFNKPFNVLCQFTKEKDSELALSDYSLPKEIYPAGRLDKDSEGLLLLTNDGGLINTISSPNFNKVKTYWAQVENIPTEDSLKQLSDGVVIKGGYLTKKCQVKVITAPVVSDRVPPIRARKSIPTCWLELKITEGKNRQVRRMTAAIGHPTLRLIRVGLGKIQLPSKLLPGQYQILSKSQIL